jgi:copper transport protein
MSRLVVLLGIGAALVISTASTASAHAGLSSSSPSDGEVVATAPSSVTLAFTEPPDIELSSITMLGGTGATVPIGPLEQGDAPRSLMFSLPDDLSDGVYTVAWRVVSSADGHPTADVFAFGVGTSPGEVIAAPEASAEAAPSPSPMGVAGKILLYAGLTFAVGAVVTARFTFGGAAQSAQLLPIVGLVALIGALLVTMAEADTIGAPVGDLLAAETGRPYIWLVAACALTLGASTAASRATSQAPLMVMGVAAVAAMVIRATSGHAAAIVPAWPAELAQSVHFLAIGIWIGGLPWLILRLRSPRAAGTSPPVAEVVRFSRLAGWAVLAVVLTGTVRSVGEAGGIDGLLAMLGDTSYGTALLVKIGLALGLISLGAFNRRRSIPRLGSHEALLRRVVAIEMVVALGIFGLTATLTSLNPDPSSAYRERPVSPSIMASGADFATTTRVTLTATPGIAGPNTFVASIVDYDDRTPLDADEVTVLFSAIGRPEIEPSSLTLQPGRPGAQSEPSGTPEGGGAAHTSGHAAWTASGTQLSLAGAWEVVVQVRSGARTTEVPLVLITRAPPTTSSVSRQPGLPEIETFTLSTGEQLQIYLDPGTAGANELHVTAFDPGGDELPLSGIVVVADGPDGGREVLESTRRTQGHFSTPAEVETGGWRFHVVATTEGGTVLQATHDQEVEP